MSEWIIKHSDGSPLKDANGNDVTTKTLEYSGSWMGECFVTITFNSSVPISFKIGDYLTYRGEIFEINYDPGKIKQSRRNEHGEAFVYNNVKFNAKQDELARTEFLDVVLHDNNIHYTSLTKFSFYASSLDDLLDRIQANLDEQWGQGEWKIYSRNKLRSGQRGCVDAVWDKTYGSGVADNVIKSTSITADGLNCWTALALVNSQFNVNFIVRGRNVFVGTVGLPTSMIFEYGKGRGLYQIEQNADSEQAITTRLRAYGSTKNLPNRYYATLNLQAFATVSSIETKGGSDGNYNIQAHLDLPFSIAYFYNQLQELSDGRPSYLVTMECGGFKVKASVFKAKNSEKTCFFAAHNNTLNLASHQNDLADIQNFGNAVEVGQRITFLSGVKKESFPRDNKTYATDNLPNNMAVDHLMLPGFPNKSLKQWWEEQSNDVRDRIYGGEKSHLFSENKYRPFIDSANITEIGVRPNSVYFETENLQEGLVEIFPTIEEMEVGGVRIDEIQSADKIEDNGVFKDGASIPNFHIYLKSAIDFDINDLIGNSTETPTISMRDGMCGGRTFQINSAKKLGDGSWELNCQRVKDESLNLYFPYNDYLIKEGDHFVLLGIPLPDSYVEAASRKLLKYALEYLDKNDYTRYIYAPKIDDVFMARQHDKAITDTTGTIVSLHDTIKEGDIMQFDDNDLNINGKIAIDQLTIRENEDKIPSYEITLREDKSVGTIQKIQEKVNSLWSGNGGSFGTEGNNLTVPQIQRLIESYGGQNFLNKLKPDTAQEVITFLKGVAVGNGYGITELGDLFARFIKANSVKSDDFRSGLLDGAGYGIYKDEYGKSIAEVDKLNVRQKATFSELEYRRLAFTTGDVGFTSASAHISDVIPIDNTGVPIVKSTIYFQSANKQVLVNNALLSYSTTPNGKTITAYRCYFLADDGDRRTSNDWRIGDQAMCKTSNLVSRTAGSSANRYYWRLVVNKGTETINGKLYHFVDLSDIRGTLELTIDGKQYTCIGYDTKADNDIPKADDDIIQLGSQTDKDRQYAHIIYVSEGKRVDYAGINNYDLASHIINEFSPKEITVRSDRFKIISAAGAGVSGSLVCDRGEWVEGTTAGHYDRFSYQGSLWLCNVGKGMTTAEAPSENSRVWIKQVSQDAAYTISIVVKSGLIRNGEGSVTLEATLYKGNIDVSDEYHHSVWSWKRNSGDIISDRAWDNTHQGVGREITITASEVVSSATFDCEINN
jgi:hypothetical protein|nr:MAG TPA: tail protein [Caudoviricetes sp.]